MAIETAIETPLMDVRDRHRAGPAAHDRARCSHCSPMLDYPDSEWSVFYEKSLR
jgi:putative acetyltransferase